MKRSNRKRRLALAALLALIVSASAYAFTATNTFTGAVNNAGDGTGAISGFNVDEVHYTIDAVDPTLMSDVQIVLNAPASDARVRVDANPWTTCTAASTPNATWDCAFAAPLAIQPTANLQVVAVS